MSRCLLSWAQVAAVIVLEVNCLEQTIAHQQIVQRGFLLRMAESGWLFYHLLPLLKTASRATLTLPIKLRLIHSVNATPGEGLFRRKKKTKNKNKQYPWGLSSRSTLGTCSLKFDLYLLTSIIRCYLPVIWWSTAEVTSDKTHDDSST